MKNAKYAIIAFACVAAICLGFYFFAESQTSNEKELTEIEKILVKDLDKDYPKTPREVVKLYNRIIACYYGKEDVSDEQLNGLIEQMRGLFDEDQLQASTQEEYRELVKADIALYKELKRYIVKTDVSDSKDVMYPSKTSTEEDEMAYIDTSYFVNTNGEFTYTYQRVELRKDEEGHWKIRSYKQIEGEASDDE